MQSLQVGIRMCGCHSPPSCYQGLDACNPYETRWIFFAAGCLRVMRQIAATFRRRCVVSVLANLPLIRCGWHQCGYVVHGGNGILTSIQTWSSPSEVFGEESLLKKKEPLRCRVNFSIFDFRCAIIRASGCIILYYGVWRYELGRFFAECFCGLTTWIELAALPPFTPVGVPWINDHRR